jgi:hypothetical protein
MEQSSTIKTTSIETGTYSIASQPLTFGAQVSGETWVKYQTNAVTIDGGGTGYADANGVNNLTIKGLTFQNLGVGPNGGGMYLSGSGETIQGNTFLNSLDSAISGASLTNSLISNNTVNGQSPGNFDGTSNEYAAMLFWYGSSGDQITHNLIENAQGGGIQFSAGPTDPANNNDIIDSNKLINVDTSTFDNGAIYLDDRTHTATGDQITNNVIDGNGNGQNNDETKGIYLDDLTSNVLVSGNLLYGNVGEYGIQFHGGNKNTIQNNVFDLSSGETLGLYQDDPTWGQYGMTSNDFKSNIVYYTGAAPSPQWEWAQSDTSMAALADTGNLYYSASGAAISNSGPIVDSRPYYANPQFQSASTGNFSMPSTSPAYTDLGWKTLATNQGLLS